MTFPINERVEDAYQLGIRAAWTAVLRDCLYHLGYSSQEGEKIAWIKEREEAINILRQVCARYGDNDWEENLHLGDVIEKHLWKHLSDRSDK